MKPNRFRNISEHSIEKRKAENADELNTSSAKSYDELYGDYVAKTLVPQIARVSAEKLSAMPKNWNVMHNEKINSNLESIFANVNLSNISYNLEDEISLSGGTVIIFDKIKDDKFNLYVPIYSVTKIEPSSGELIYLQIARYYTGGNFLNIITETKTINETKYDYFQLDKDTPLPTKKEFEKNKNFNKDNKKDKEDIKNDLKEIGIEGILPKEDIVENKMAFINAEYFQNIPTKTFRGKPDIINNETYELILNKIYIRLHWEIDFNKSKLLINNSQSISSFGSNTAQYNQMVEENFAVRSDSFLRPLGSGADGFDYYETNNQNLLNLTTQFNFFLRKYWENAGQHQSGSDFGKQLTELEAEMERGAETRRYQLKAESRDFNYRRLLWKMIQNMEGGTKIKITDISFKTNVHRIQIEKTVIQNEIMKIQANITDREKAIMKIEQNSIGDISKYSEDILDNNIEDIKKELEAKPIQVQEPTISSPKTKVNNQNKGFDSQLDKKGEE